MKDPVLPAVSLLASLLVWLPFPFHFRLRNYAVMIMIFWLSLGNLVTGINSIIWWSNTTQRGYPWCDISSRLYLMAQIGVAICNFVLSRKLALISSLARTTRLGSERRRESWIEISLGFGVPTVHIILALLYQGHRYDLYEGFGCEGATHQSWPFIVFGLLPPLLLSIATLIMSSIAMARFISRRAQFQAVLQSSHSAFDKGRFLRLLALTSIEAFWGLPVTLTLTVISIAGMRAAGSDLSGAYSWSTVHYHYYQVGTYPAAIWDYYPKDKEYATWELGHWVLPISALIFFGLYGFTREFRAAYSPRGLLCGKRTSKASPPTQLSTFTPRSFDSLSQAKASTINEPFSFPGKSDISSEDVLQVQIHQVVCEAE